MKEDFFQDVSSDLFQDDFLPGRQIPTYDLTIELSQKIELQEPRFTDDGRNKSDWITVIYKSAYYAEKASKALPSLGLNVYYPKCRYKEKEIKADWDSRNLSSKSKKSKQVPSEFVPAYGRYLFIQLPEDAETFENLEVTERMLAGRFDENGIVNIMSIEGEYSLTRHNEIVANQQYHTQLIDATNPKTTLRFCKNEIVKVVRGNLEGYFVSVCTDIFMYFKLTSKTEVLIGNTGARHYVKVGDLEKC